mgnify:CR=1 FL=1
MDLPRSAHDRRTHFAQGSVPAPDIHTPVGASFFKPKCLRSELPRFLTPRSTAGGGEVPKMRSFYAMLMAALLTLSMALTVAGCGGSQTEAPATSEEPVSSEPAPPAGDMGTTADTAAADTSTHH